MSEATTYVHRDARNRALLAAEGDRARRSRDAEIEYSETVAKLREAFAADLAEAGAHLHAQVLPAHRAYNAAVIAAERTYQVAEARNPVGSTGRHGAEPSRSTHDT